MIIQIKMIRVNFKHSYSNNFRLFYSGKHTVANLKQAHIIINSSWHCILSYTIVNIILFRKMQKYYKQNRYRCIEESKELYKYIFFY